MIFHRSKRLSMHSFSMRLYSSTFLMLALLFSATSHAAQTNAIDIIKSPNDDREYLAFTLENGLSALVISDPKADHAAASLDVKVGSSDDPKNFLGLAHFLEHMLFLGTEKFPKADEYQAFIDNHSGSHNAFTAYDRTNYYFSIDQQYLEPAIDRFSQFFIAPLFTPEYVEREKHAVHSEYQSRSKDAFRRSHAVYKQVINPEHPQAKFSIGSLETLADKPEQSTRGALLTFYKKHYSSDQMTLTILGQQSTAELQKLAEKYFSAIPSRPVKQTKASVPLFNKGQLPLLIRVKSLKENHRLNLMFPVPPVATLYREKPLSYISSMLGDESQGSLVQQLKDKGWVKNLGAGPGLNYDDAASLLVSMTLTPEGYRHYDEIIALTFDYIELIKSAGITAARFQQEAALNDISFRFQEKRAPSSYVIGLSNNLRHYPIQDVIYGDYAFSNFDAKLISEYVAKLTPDNVLITLSSADEDTNQTEHWFKTEYRIEPWSLMANPTPATEALSAQLALPASNPFIPEDFSIRTNNATDKPSIIAVQPGFRLWHQLDADFPAPKSNLYLTFRSPLANDSALHQVSTQLYVNLVKKALNTELYPAEIVGHNVNLYNHARGFSLRLQGYRDKQNIILDKVTRTLKNLKIDPKQLTIAKNSLRLGIENQTQDKPYNQTIAKVYKELLNPSWSDEERLDSLQWITPAYLQDFAAQLLSLGEIDVLAHGNISADEAKLLVKPLLQQLHQNLDITSPPMATVNKVPTNGETIEFSVPHTDNALTFYVQAADNSLATKAQYQLLEQMLGSRYYNQLRTEEQLGYAVFASYFPVYHFPGLAFVVQSPVATADELAQRTNDFIEQQLQAAQTLTNEELAGFKSSLLAGLLQRDNTLDQRTNRYWQEIDLGYVYFDSKEWLAKAIKETSVEDLQQALKSLQQRHLIIKAVPQ